MLIEQITLGVKTSFFSHISVKVTDVVVHKVAVVNCDLAIGHEQNVKFKQVQPRISSNLALSAVH